MPSQFEKIATIMFYTGFGVFFVLLCIAFNKNTSHKKECAEAALIFKLECLDQDVWDLNECQVLTELHEIDCHKIKGIR